MKEIYIQMWKDITPTDFFYSKIENVTYHAGKNPILSYREDSNLLFAQKDNDAIFLYSKNQVLSLIQFINAFVTLYEVTMSVSSELSKNIYAGFGFSDLNINFVDMILATGAKPEFMEKYDSNFKKVNDSKNTYTSELNGVKTIYNAQDEAVIYTYFSQSGMNLIDFLDIMIRLNPDIRLLMSNTVATPYRSTVIEIFLNAIKDYDKFRYYTTMEIVQFIENLIKSGVSFESKEQMEFFEIFEKEKQKANSIISKSNRKYEVFSALKYVLELQEGLGEVPNDLDSRTYMK